MKKFTLILCAFFAVSAYLKYIKIPQNILPIVAIANYGPHSSIEDSIKGFKAELNNQGFKENVNVKFEYADVGFDAALIPQMITKLKSAHPKLIVTIGTPISQYAKGAIKDIPLVYDVITDPVEAGLLEGANTAGVNMSGASDKQDLDEMLKFMKQLMPTASKVGMLYATSETNDLALLKMLQNAAQNNGFEVTAIAVDQAREVSMKMQAFKEKVDFIYVGTSGTIQPALPAIIAEANKIKVPVVNVNEEAVIQKMALASYGVNYYQVGVSAGIIASQVLNGAKISSLKPLYPMTSDHLGYVSREKAAFFGIEIPANLTNVTIVE